MKKLLKNRKTMEQTYQLLETGANVLKGRIVCKSFNDRLIKGKKFLGIQHLLFTQ